MRPDWKARVESGDWRHRKNAGFSAFRLSGRWLLLWGKSAFLFYSGFHPIGWSPLTLIKAIYSTQSTYLNVNLIHEKLPHRNTHCNVWPNIWVPGGAVSCQRFTIIILTIFWLTIITFMDIFSLFQEYSWLRQWVSGPWWSRKSKYSTSQLSTHRATHRFGLFEKKKSMYKWIHVSSSLLFKGQLQQDWRF